MHLNHEGGQVLLRPAVAEVVAQRPRALDAEDLVCVYIYIYIYTHVHIYIMYIYIYI